MDAERRKEIIEEANNEKLGYRMDKAIELAEKAAAEEILKATKKWMLNNDMIMGADEQYDAYEEWFKKKFGIGSEQDGAESAKASKARNPSAYGCVGRWKEVSCRNANNVQNRPSEKQVTMGDGKGAKPPAKKFGIEEVR